MALPDGMIISPGRTSNTGIVASNTSTICTPDNPLPRKTLVSLPHWNPDQELVPMKRAVTAKQLAAQAADQTRREAQDAGLLRAIRHTR